MSYGCRQITPTVPIDLDTVDRTLASLLIQQAGKDPGRSYLYGHFGRISYGETLTRVRQLAQCLASSDGMARRQSVAVSTETPEYLAYALWAAAFADISIVLLPLCRDAQVMLSAMQETAVDVLLTDEPQLLQESWCQDLKALLRRCVSEDGQTEVSAETLPAASRDGEAGIIFQTSGTQAEPKWVRCEYGKFYAVIDCMRHKGALEHARGQSVFLTPPLYHSYGVSALLEYTSVGGTVILPQGNSPLGPVGELRDPVLRERVTAIEAVPYFYTQLSRLADRFKMPALNHFGLGGGGLDGIAFARLCELYPAVTVSVRYGMTETPSVVSQKLFRRPFQGDWRSSGRVLPVYTVEIVDAAGRTQARDQEGEIIVSGDCVGRYLGQTGSRLLTGDTGYLSSGGELVITGRKSLYIRNRGFRLSPERIESVIASCAGVQDCRVRMSDDRLVAEVVYDDSLSQRELLAFVAARSPSYALPDEVVKVKRVPRTDSGKIRRY